MPPPRYLPLSPAGAVGPGTGDNNHQFFIYGPQCENGPHFGLFGGGGGEGGGEGGGGGGLGGP